MTPVSPSISHQIRPPSFEVSRHTLSTQSLLVKLHTKITPNHHQTTGFQSFTVKSQHAHQNNNNNNETPQEEEDGIPSDQVKVLLRFKSRHNYIRVLQVSRKADHPFAGSRLLLLDKPGNIHSISFLFHLLTNTYFDVFATLPPILPPGEGPLGILGFGAGSAARLILELYPFVKIYGWELDPSVISVGREYFGLSKLEKQYPDRLIIYVGDALKASFSVGQAFTGIFVDLFAKGSLIPELQDPNTWKKMKQSLKKEGRVMVNVGGTCVEAEDKHRDGKLVMEETLKAMQQVFPDQLFVLSLGNTKQDSCIALTGDLPDLDAWKQALPSSLRYYVDMWTPFRA